MKVISSTALGAALQAKAVSGYLKKLSVAIDRAAASNQYFVQVFDSASAPADTTAVQSNMPRVVRANHVTGGSDTEIDYDFTDGGKNEGLFFVNGIYVCVSTTQFTKTLAGSVAVITAEVE